MTRASLARNTASSWRNSHIRAPASFTPVPNKIVGPSSLAHSLFPALSAIALLTKMTRRYSISRHTRQLLYPLLRRSRGSCHLPRRPPRQRQLHILFPRQHSAPVGHADQELARPAAPALTISRRLRPLRYRLRRRVPQLRLRTPLRRPKL